MSGMVTTGARVVALPRMELVGQSKASKERLLRLTRCANGVELNAR